MCVGCELLCDVAWCGVVCVFGVFVYRCVSARFVCDLLCDVVWFVLCVIRIVCGD